MEKRAEGGPWMVFQVDAYVLSREVDVELPRAHGLGPTDSRTRQTGSDSSACVTAVTAFQGRYPDIPRP